MQIMSNMPFFCRNILSKIKGLIPIMTIGYFKSSFTAICQHYCINISKSFCICFFNLFNTGTFSSCITFLSSYYPYCCKFFLKKSGSVKL